MPLAMSVSAGTIMGRYGWEKRAQFRRRIYGKSSICSNGPFGRPLGRA